ncbi:ATP-grasp ribosomal peptide maturase, SAV_5884 family [Actinopolyspora xinjiangensis]|uniref:ATP-grasp ribosomal peptide maturase, SAV_5884 family n=1 Tax=Actinopolyspora xinjiangensis TaxID=405564 RepID=A0A1H0RMN1_9ACTN|nr:hypothetical protein [Actinopolyspora xinjiangensis]SDP30727.1 ATP-grasp ribosomal peptide maturase, SAV_5884 family [Actinopolyspora xinjiangensis]
MTANAATVAVITREHDVTADLVVAELHRREVPVFRFDLSGFPEGLTQRVRLTGRDPRWHGSIRDVHRRLELTGLRAVWLRKPSGFAPHPTMTATERQCAAAEARAGLGGLLTSLSGARWINHPHANAAAKDKPHQLRAAVACGLPVPDTLLTNDPEAAREFCAEHRETGVIHKPLRGGPGTGDGRHVALWARPVTPELVTDGVARTTHLFQERVPCAYPVRLTVVDDRMFAVRLDPPQHGRAVDRRAHPSESLRYTPVEVPAGVAAADLIVTPEGRWVFHGDLNPNGQWGWIAAHTGLPIARAIADALTEEAA